MSEFDGAFAALKAVMAKFAGRLAVKADSPGVYTLVTKKPSPFPQHKEQPMWFGEVRLGKAYASFHLMPLYMNDALTGMISSALKKRMQGKSCFNFKGEPEPEVLAELEHLTEAGLKAWDAKRWI